MRGRAGVGGSDSDCISWHHCQKDYYQTVPGLWNTGVKRWVVTQTEPFLHCKVLMTGEQKSAFMSAHGLIKLAQHPNKSTSIKLQKKITKIPVCSQYMLELEVIGRYCWCALIPAHTTFAKRLVSVKEQECMCPDITNSITSTDLTLARSTTLASHSRSVSYHRHTGGSRNTAKCSQVRFPWNTLLHPLYVTRTQAQWRSCSKGLLTPPPWHQDPLAGPKQLAKPADSY